MRILDMIGLAASLVFAVPLGNYAVGRLLDGHTALGGGLLLVAVAMVALPQYLLDPGRILGALVRGFVPARFRDAEQTETETPTDEP